MLINPTPMYSAVHHIQRPWHASIFVARIIVYPNVDDILYQITKIATMAPIETKYLNDSVLLMANNNTERKMVNASTTRKRKR